MIVERQEKNWNLFKKHLLFSELSVLTQSEQKIPSKQSK